MDRMRSCVRTGSVIFALTLLPISSVHAQAPVYVTQWGSLGTDPGQFSFIYRVTTDAAGFVYAGDVDRIQKFTGTGGFITLWNSAGASNDGFTPYAMDFDARGKLWVADWQKNRVLEFTDTGQFQSEFWDQYSFPGGIDGLAVGPSGDIYISNPSTDEIRRFQPNGNLLSTFGSHGSGDGQFYSPRGIAFDASGNLYVADYYNDRIQKFAADGTYLLQWGTHGTGDGEFFYPVDVAPDNAGHVYVVDYVNERIQMFTDTGGFLAKWGTPGTGNGEFDDPNGIAVDFAGNIYVADSRNRRIQKFAPTFTTVPVALSLPSTINLQSMGHWVNATLEPAAGYDVAAIDVASLRFHGNVTGATPVPVDPDATGGGDGNPNHLTVKFDRAAVGLTLTDGHAVPVSVTGVIGGQDFQANATVKVMRATVTAPAATAELGAGMPTTVRWLTPSGADVQSVALLSSIDDGASWTLEANGLPNTGSHDWITPTTESDRVRVAVVLVESADETGFIVEGVLGVSEAFAIRGIAAVGDAPSALALARPSPNPWRGGALTVSFALPRSEAATLELVDLTGRRIASRAVGMMGTGRHDLALNEARGVAPGLYWIRLTQGASARTAPLVVLQ